MQAMADEVAMVEADAMDEAAELMDEEIMGAMAAEVATEMAALAQMAAAGAAPLLISNPLRAVAGGARPGAAAPAGAATGAGGLGQDFGGAGAGGPPTGDLLGGELPPAGAAAAGGVQGGVKEREAGLAQAPQGDGGVVM
jgi:hypothetical protein